MPSSSTAALDCATPAREHALAHAGKFDLPGPNASLVRRHAVTERIDRAAAAKLVLVRAPAGFGKTTALRQIHEQLQARGVATAWITLDVLTCVFPVALCIPLLVDALTGAWYDVSDYHATMKPGTTTPTAAASGSVAGARPVVPTGSAAPTTMAPRPPASAFAKW